MSSRGSLDAINYYVRSELTWVSTHRIGSQEVVRYTAPNGKTLDNILRWVWVDEDHEVLNESLWVYTTGHFVRVQEDA